MSRSYTYEVIIEVGGKPEIEGIYPEEKLALDRAQYLLKLAKYTAVRVYQINSREANKLIFEKFYSGQGGGGSTISGITEAFLCVSLADVYSFDSRYTLLKLLRSYFDQQLAIPMELLHNYMMLRYLERDDLLFNQAAHRLAAVQAKAARIRATDRHDALTKLFRQVLEQAKNAEKLAPYASTLADCGLDRLIEEVTRELPSEEHARVISYAISHYTAETRDWSLKLEAACDLYEDQQSEQAAAWLDELLAEIIDGNEAVRAVLGYAPDLCSVLESLLTVIDGSWDDRYPGTQALQKLSDVMARRPLPRVREAILARVASAIDGKAPLTRLDRAANVEAFKRLVPKLREFGGFMGSTVMSIALIRRAKVVLGNGVDDLSFESTVSILNDFLLTPAAKIGFLLDVLSSEMGRRKASYLTQEISELFNNVRSIYDFAPDLDGSWSQDMVREDFRRRLQHAGIPHRLIEGLLRKLTQLSNSHEKVSPQLTMAPPTAGPALSRLPPRPTTPALPPPVESPVRSVVSGGVAKGGVQQPKGPGYLILNYRGNLKKVEEGQTPFLIGRSDTCQLSVDWGAASRSHAAIEVLDGNFVLTDHSKNGTFVRGEDEKTVALSNSSTVLTGRGVITIGTNGEESETEELARIRYQRVVAS